MNNNVRIARQLVRIAKMLVGSDDDGSKAWKVLRVLNNGTREVFVERLYFSESDSDSQKMNSFEEAVQNTGYKIPDDCDIYADGDQYVLRHDDGTIEYRMCLDTDNFNSLQRSKYFVLKYEQNGTRHCVNVMRMADSETIRDKTGMIVGWCKKQGVNVRRSNVEYVPEREWFTVKDDNGNMLYLISKKKEQNGSPSKLNGQN